MAWKDDQKFEAGWWDNCVNTYWEETKQLSYAKRMGLQAQTLDGKYPVYDLKGKSILDIGGGPVSMLLKCININSYSGIVDPCDYPDWVLERYKKIIPSSHYTKMKGEDITRPLQGKEFDEVWIYNVLQHTEDPEKIIRNARNMGKLIRIFEWIDMPPTEGHPQMLVEEKLNIWLGGEGKVEQINENGAIGKCYYGIFKGNFYEKV